MKLFNEHTPKNERIFIICGIIFFFSIVFGTIVWVIYDAFPHPDKVNYDCSDFPSQNDAQNYFIEQGGSKVNNVDNLDSDGDGIVCENLKHYNPQPENNEY